MGGGSDFAPFAYVVGAPTTDFGYTVRHFGYQGFLNVYPSLHFPNFAY